MKITLEQQQETSNALIELINKCHEDVSFKERLINSPRETLKDIGADVEVEEGKKLVIEDQTDSNTIYLNIPSVPNLDELELTEEQMETIAGGTELSSEVGYNKGWNFKVGIKIKFK